MVGWMPRVNGNSPGNSSEMRTGGVGLPLLTRRL
jgi:hypothetical protein